MYGLDFELLVTFATVAILMGIFAIRAKVWPSASLFIKATPEAVFKLVDLVDGKNENWGQVKVTSQLVDTEKGIFKKTFTSTMANGALRSVDALFSIRERIANQKIVIARAGLAGKALHNELLSQAFLVTPESDGCRLKITYEWGPRPLIAQLIARADLWGGIFRIRGLAEKGHPVEWPYAVITIVMSLVTALLSVWAFALFLSWTWAFLLVFALFIHELGHLISYRMMGQPWGRMIFLPFLGAVAMPRFPFESQGQMVFAALMGPGFSLLLATGCLMGMYYLEHFNPALAFLGWITCILNIFNLLPAEPLDGGIALRSVLGRYMGRSANFGLMAVGIVIAGIGLITSKALLTAFGAVAIVLNIKRRTIDVGMAPLTFMQFVLTLLFYANILIFYVVLYYNAFDQAFHVLENSLKP
jgi:Zn-dependent protease